MKIKNAIFIGVAVAGIALACSKENAVRNGKPDQDVLAAAIEESAGVVTSICDQFAYPDSIFYPAELPNDYIVKPVKPLTGTYGAFPDGLKINPVNGNIDITESETGLKYMIWFIPKGTRDTCLKYITVSGINYTDSVYVLANNPGVASPIYNANTLKPTDCSGGCEFDDGPDDDDGDGVKDEPVAGQQVIPQGIAMNKATGAINLRKSLQNGALGKNPISGTYKDFMLNYRISDKSSKALNKIAFRIYYYKTQAEIPVSLKNELSTKQSQVLLENEDEDEDDDHSGGHGGNSGHGGNNRTSSFMLAAAASATGNTTAKHGAGETKCRPPYIIVTQK